MGSVTPGVRRILAWSGWEHSNIGDVGHTPGLLRTLEEFVPEAPVTLVANQLDARTRRMLATRFPAVDVHEGGLWEDDDTGRRLRGLLDGGDVGLFVRASNMGSETAYMDELIGRGVPFGGACPSGCMGRRFSRGSSSVVRRRGRGWSASARPRSSTAGRRSRWACSSVRWANPAPRTCGSCRTAVSGSTCGTMPGPGRSLIGPGWRRGSS